MFPAGYATPHLGIFLTLRTGRTGRAGYLLAISADQYWQVAIAGEGCSAEEWCRKHELP